MPSMAQPTLGASSAVADSLVSSLRALPLLPLSVLTNSKPLNLLAS